MMLTCKTADRSRKLLAGTCAFAFLLLVSTPAVQARMHTITLYVHVTRGKVGAHFSEYKGQIFRPHFIKVKSRDDDNHHPVTPGDPWDETGFTVKEGTYVFDLPDWRDNPEAEIFISVDGKWILRGHGSAPNFKHWSLQYGSGFIRQSDDREVRIGLD